VFGVVAVDDEAVWRRLDGCSLLSEAIEEHAASLGRAAAKSEGEFVEAVVKMLVLDAALQGSQSERDHEAPRSRFQFPLGDCREKKNSFFASAGAPSLGVAHRSSAVSLGLTAP
jgi:hypothetical protein